MAALLERGHLMQNVVMVVDNAPYHARFEEALAASAKNGEAVLTIQWLSPYSPVVPIPSAMAVIDKQLKID